MNNTTVIVLSLLLGGAVGTVFSVIDHLLLLRTLRKLSLNDEMQNKQSIARVYAVRYIINIAVLIIVFAVRNYLPFNWEFILIGTAIGLTLPARVLAMHMGLEKKPGEKLTERLAEPEKIDDLMPRKAEDGRVIVDEKAFLREESLKK
ncbi:MAG: hypothetical protein PHN47_02955 [Clostridia bacterium]|jgi:hypothetical protein|nr:hypothetical protein [Clostridia bacterium]MDD4571430.1 hypothetical protein [Clostridia bacterium]